MPSSSTMKLIQDVSGPQKWTVLASHIDNLRSLFFELKERSSIDEQIETLDLDELAKQYGVTAKTLRERITRVLGSNVVIRLGKKRVIRKTRFLDYLHACEQEGS